MKRLQQWLVGLRDDLDLHQRWWHRLSLVTVSLSTVAVAVVVGILSHRPIAPNAGNIVVIARLGAYTAAHPELANTVPTFAALGHVAFETPSGAIVGYGELESEYFCSADLGAHPTEVAVFLRRADAAAYAEMDAEKAAQWLGAHAAGGEVGNCIGRKDLDRPESSKIISYRLGNGALVFGFVRAALWGAAGAFLWCLVALNAYYRGLMYVLFGSRRQSVAGPDVGHNRGAA